MNELQAEIDRIGLPRTEPIASNEVAAWSGPKGMRRIAKKGEKWIPGPCPKNAKPSDPVTFNVIGLYTVTDGSGFTVMEGGTSAEAVAKVKKWMEELEP